MKTEEEVVKKMRDDLKQKHRREREIEEETIEHLIRPLIRQGLVDDVKPGGRR